MRVHKAGFAVLVAVGLSASGNAASGRPTSRAEPSPLSQYVQARAADAAGETEVAARGYAAILAQSPDDAVLALRTFRQAIAAGDRALAVRTAHMLESRRLLPPDGRLLLLTEAVLASDWRLATEQVNRIEAEGMYGFAAPVMRAWIAQGSGSGDAMAMLDTARAKGAIAIAYAAEHRALIALAQGETAEALTIIRSQAGGATGRGVRLRLTAAKALAKAGDRRGALALLDGNDTTLAAARRLISAGRTLPGGVDDTASGLSALFARAAIDINRERVTPMSLTLIRLATFLAPANAENWLITSEILSAAEQHDAALAAVARIRPDDPFAEAAGFARVQLLVRRGDTEKALAEAQVATKAKGAIAEDWARVGQLQAELERHGDAAASFSRALALTPPQDPNRWTLLLQQGSALDQAGNWAAARPVLEEVVRIAPDQASALNYLGYAQLERRINLPEAEKLIERASRLRPDDAAISDSLGWTYYLRGDMPKAIATLEAAVTAEPGEPTINEHLGDAYWRVGRRLEARYAWRAALPFAADKDGPRIRRKIDGGWTPEVAAP